MSDDKSPLDSDTIEPEIVLDGEVMAGVLLIQSYPDVDPAIADEIFRKGSVAGYRAGFRRGYREGKESGMRKTMIFKSDKAAIEVGARFLGLKIDKEKR